MSRIALIGAGYIAHTHAEVVVASPGLSLHSVCDVDRGRAEAFAHRFGVARIATDPGELLAHDPPDAFHVTVPPPLHAAVARPLLEAGASVLLEKPMAVTLGEARELRDLAAKSGAPLGINHNALLHPRVVEMLDALGRGEIGPVEHVTSVVSIPLRQLDAGQIGHWMFRDPRHLVLELLPHTFSLVERILGACRDLQVVPRGRRNLASGAELPRSQDLSFEGERGTGQIHFRPGGDFEEWWISILGKDGSLRVDLTYEDLELRERTRWLPALDRFLVGHRNARRLGRSARRGLLGYSLSKIGLGGRCDGFYLSMRDGIRAFHDAVARKVAPPSGAEEGVRVMEYCDAVVRSESLAGYPAAADCAGAGSAAKPASPPAILVTGATGFIGGHLVERLVARGTPVRVFLRRSTALPSWLRSPLVERVQGDLLSREALGQAVAGAKTVVHLATGGGESWSEMEASMIGGAVEIAHLCRESGARMIFASSIAALDLGDPSGVITEATPPDARPSSRAIYSRAKIECERALRRIETEDGLALLVVRPGIVVGRRGNCYPSGVGYWANPRHCLGFSSGNHPLAFVLVEDVADGLLAAIDREDLRRRSLNLVGDVRWTAREYVRHLAEESGRRVEFHPTSPLRLEAIDALKWMVKRVGGEKAPFPSLRDFRSRGMAARFDCTATKAALSWQPVADEGEFLERAIRCYFRGAEER